MSVAPRAGMPGVRHPSPMEVHEKRLEEWLRARMMALEPIGDIADVNMGGAATETLTWETATDWDNAVSETGVGHYSQTNTDYSDASTIRIAYDYATFAEFTPDPIASYPFHEDSGSTANDLSGNGNDGAINGATVGQTGLLGTSAYSFDGSDDDVSISDASPLFPTTFTVTCWVYVTSANVYNGFVAKTDSNVAAPFELRTSNDSAPQSVDFWVGNGSSGDNVVSSSDVIPLDTWTFVAVTYDDGGKSGEIFIDGTSANTGTTNQSVSDSDTKPLMIGDRDDGVTPMSGRIADVRAYDTVLSASQIQTLYDVVDTEGTLTTATKSFSSATSPNLQNLSYALNSQSITLDVIGSPGTASEEIVSQTLDGATSYSLTWSNSHTDFRLKPRLSTSDPTVTPTFGRGELVTP